MRGRGGVSQTDVLVGHAHAHLTLGAGLLVAAIPVRAGMRPLQAFWKPTTTSVCTVPSVICRPYSISSRMHAFGRPITFRFDACG